MSTFHYSNLRVKFEGEEGSGPGVNRGFFAAMANALKTDEKVGKLSLEIKAAMKLFKQMKNLNVLISTEPSEKKKKCTSVLPTLMGGGSALPLYVPLCFRH